MVGVHRGRDVLWSDYRSRLFLLAPSFNMQTLMDVKLCKYCSTAMVKRDDESIRHFLFKRKFCSRTCNIRDQKKNQTGFGEWSGKKTLGKRVV